MPQMTCKQLIGFLDDYVDGNLSPEVRSLFDAHLAQCPHCVEYLRSYQATMELSRRACDGTDDGAPADGVPADGVSADVPEELVTAVLRALKRSE